MNIHNVCNIARLCIKFEYRSIIQGFDNKSSGYSPLHNAKEAIRSPAIWPTHKCFAIIRILLPCLLISYSSSITALGGQWYLGGGGGVSILRPIPSATITDFELDDNSGNSFALYFGRDVDEQSSAQIQLYSLGNAVFENGQSTQFNALDATVLYRFYDTRDVRPDSTLALSLYGRLGLGFINRNTEVTLSKDAAPIYIGAGAGLETYITNNLGVRLEAFYHEADASSILLTVVSRFGKNAKIATESESSSRDALKEFSNKDSNTSDSVSTTQTESILKSNEINTNKTETDGSTNTAPAERTETTISNKNNENTASDPDDDISTDINESTTIASATDAENRTKEYKDVTETLEADQDKIADINVDCLESSPGYPANEKGCSIYPSIAKQLIFADNSATINRLTLQALNELVSLLNEYPSTRIEIIAHTDSSGTEERQLNLTILRLRGIGMYLVKQGINKNRLLLRSFAAKRPIDTNSTEAGRFNNNRIEILENPE